ncbi:MAG TPA: HD family hydrolase [Kiloniellaceae bacterium]|nr:HD family hydrolase [Kiloniellaceae bacterium]
MTAARAWQRMLSGRRLDLLDPSPLDVEIEDIALGLSRVARWNGQTEGDWAYSVAQHSLLVEELAGAIKKDLPAHWRLAALLHDGPEYVVGDLITPFKAAVGEDYKSLERRLQGAVHLRFGLPASLPEAVGKLIKRADRMAAYLEATQLAGFGEDEAKRIFGRPRNLIEVALVSDKPEAARRAFLARFSALSKQRLDAGRAPG